MAEQLVLVNKKEKIYEISLNRPDAYNALSTELMVALNDALLDFRKDPDCHVGILRGKGKNFCSGADIKQFGDAKAQTGQAMRQRADISRAVHALFATIEKPIICSVQGYVLAGGCGLAMAGDFVIASDNAIFGYPEVKRGFVPALVLVNLSKLIGKRKALELILTGKKINASQALEIGMINEVVPLEKLDERTYELAYELSALSPDSLANTKGLYYRVVDMELHKGLECGRDMNMLMRQTKGFAQGVSEFVKIK